MADRAALFDALLDELAERVAAKLRAQPPAAPRDDGAEYYDARTAPCGRKRFLAAARAGAFPSFLDGRTIKARRADVRAWLESHPHPRAATPEPKEPSPDTVDARIDAWRDRVAKRSRAR